MHSGQLLSQAGGRSACDRELVALVDFLGVKFVTADAKLAKAFPNREVLFF